MKAAEAKRRLVDESVRLIDEQGLGGLSFREMSRRAGVSHQTPYHHFANREGILAAIAHDGFTRLNARLGKVRETDRRKRPAEILRNVIRAYMIFAVENPVHYGVMFRPELVDLKRHPETREQVNQSFQRLVDSVVACHPSIAHNEKRLMEIANALWAAAHGVATIWLDGPLRVKSPDISIMSFIDMTSEMFSQAGAKATRAGQKRSDKLSAARTTSSRTT